MARVHLIAPPPALTGPRLEPRHPPLLLASTAAALREAGHVVTVHDAHLDTPDVAWLLDRAARGAPDLVGLFPHDVDRPTPPAVTAHLATLLARRLPEARLVSLGKRTAARAADDLAACADLAAVATGDPEPAALALARGEPLAAVPGVAWRDPSGAPRQNAATQVDLDALPFPAWDLVPVARPRPHRRTEATAFPLMPSRGCPYACSFCELSAERGYRLRSVDRVLAELRWLVQTHGAREVTFMDATFAANRGWALELCDALDAARLPLRWSVVTRADRMDAQLLQRMAGAGCWSVLFGVETPSDDARAALHKRTTTVQVVEAVRQARAAGLAVTASFIVGLPGEAPADALRTAAFARELGVDYAQFFTLRVFDMLEAPSGGRVLGWDNTELDFRGPVFLPDGYPDLATLFAARRAAYRAFYLHPLTIARALRRRRSGLPGGDLGAGAGTLLRIVAGQERGGEVR